MDVAACAMFGAWTHIREFAAHPLALAGETAVTDATLRHGPARGVRLTGWP